MGKKSKLQIWIEIEEKDILQAEEVLFIRKQAITKMKEIEAGNYEKNGKDETGGG